ncbi:MAG: ribonuclease HII [Bdellovibrionaceae bacterium]|nr:ribonuclease HII [Pseudobdellovibrionaceae bacterium]
MKKTRIPQTQFSRNLLKKTLAGLPGPILGVDEVGRGCLAGPVVAGAVIFSDQKIPKGLTDSKLLSENRREEFFPQIMEAHYCGLGVASVEEIDRINILQASFLAMRRAIADLETKMVGARVGYVLVDGHMEIPGCTHPQGAVIKGDLRVPMIAAASIIAKVYRDRMMKGMDATYPHYGFGQHKGYASPVHRDAIRKHGPCFEHRQSFSGVKEFLGLGSVVRRPCGTKIPPGQLSLMEEA